MLAAVIHAKSTGIGQKVETSLVGSAFRLMGWTMTTTMWKNSPPITGARINGTPERPGIAACFNDRDGKPLAIQFQPRYWRHGIEVLGFLESLQDEGLDDLGVAFESEDKKNQILDHLGTLFATNTRDHWLAILREAGLVCAPVNTLLEAADDPNIVENNYVQEILHPRLGKNIKIHGSPWKFSETPSNPGVAPTLGQHNEEILNSLGYDDKAIAELQNKEVI